MSPLVLIAGAVWTMGTLFVWALCRVAARADEGVADEAVPQNQKLRRTT